MWWAQSAFAQDTIPLNTTHVFEVTYQPGYTYSWWYLNSGGDPTYFSSTSNKTEEVLWDTEGNYQLFAQATDNNNCLSEKISKYFVVIEKSTEFVISAGHDTTIGICKPYQLQASVELQPGLTYTYQWKPATNLDNPDKPNPVFTPGSTTTFEVTVTNSKGISASDTVKITVSEIMAEAGNDIYMVQGSTTLLDGSVSFGKKLQYLWTTIDGKIESGENTANPIVSGFGTYYLEIADTFNCVATDSVKVIHITHAPIANDDYYTTI